MFGNTASQINVSFVLIVCPKVKSSLVTVTSGNIQFWKVQCEVLCVNAQAQITCSCMNMELIGVLSDLLSYNAHFIFMI